MEILLTHDLTDFLSMRFLPKVFHLLNLIKVMSLPTKDPPGKKSGQGNTTSDGGLHTTISSLITKITRKIFQTGNFFYLYMRSVTQKIGPKIKLEH